MLKLHSDTKDRLDARSTIGMVIYMTEKQLVMDAIGGLPESASWEKIQEEFRILSAIKEGERAADTGDLLPHDEVVKRVASWHTKFTGQNRP